MNAIDLIIGEYAYRLPLGVDEDAVLEQLENAVREGGGVVELPRGAAQATVAVLISPGVAVFVERTPIPDEAIDAADDDTDGGPPEWFAL